MDSIGGLLCFNLVDLNLTADSQIDADFLCYAGGKLGLTKDELMGMIKHNKQVCIRLTGNVHTCRAQIIGLPCTCVRACVLVSYAQCLSCCT